MRSSGLTYSFSSVMGVRFLTCRKSALAASTSVSRSTSAPWNCRTTTGLRLSSLGLRSLRGFAAAGFFSAAGFFAAAAGFLAGSCLASGSAAVAMVFSLSMRFTPVL